ncbi:histidine phosphatase family protein [Candidatus Saccharibacteria bacterium TM7i]|nr:histidine phosphatase family protein [Candidatus Saccharibacteria bacterium TM7i]
MKNTNLSSEILFARHGQSEANAAGFLAGQKDVELTEEGIRQARETGAQLLEKGVVFDKIVTSPLIRAQQTAYEIADTIGYTGDIVTLKDLKERNGGTFQGRDIQEFYAASDNDIVVAGGESLADFSDRLKRVNISLGLIATGKRVLVVGHAEAFRMAQANSAGIAPELYTTIEAPRNAEVYKYPIVKSEDIAFDALVKARTLYYKR